MRKISKTLATILTLQDKMTPKLVGVSKKVAGMSTEMQRASQHSANLANKFGKNMMGMADKVVKTTLKVAALGALVGAGIVLKVGVEGLKELDEASAKVKSIAGDSLEKTDIKKGLLKTSNKTGISTQELGDTQYNAISSGIDPTESLQAAETAAKLAKAGFTDSNSSLKILTATMNVYGLKGQGAMQDISDKMMITQNMGVTTIAELSESMGSLTPVAKSAGLSIDELLGGMVGLTKNGIKTDEAVTSMKGIMTSIISPTKESADAAKRLGIDFSTSGLKAKGFAGFMEDIKTKTGGSTEEMAGLFGNVRALSGALVLAGDGTKDMTAALEAMENGTGTTDKAFAVMENTIGAKFDKFKNRFKNTCTSIVDTQSGMMGQIADKMGKWLEDNEKNIEGWIDKIGKTITKIFNIIKKVIDFVIEHKTAIINFAIVFGSFYVAVKAVLTFNKALKATGTAFKIVGGALKMTPFGWVVLGIGLLIAGFLLLYKNSSTFRAMIATIVEKLKVFGAYIMSDIVPKLKEFGAYIIAYLVPKLQQLGKYIMENVVPPLKRFGAYIMENVMPILRDFGAFIINTVVPGLKQFGSYIMENVVPILKDMATIIIVTVVAAFNFLYPIISGFITDVLIPLVTFIGGVLKEVFSVVFPYILDVITNVFNTVKGVIEGAIQVFGGIIEFIAGVFTGDWDKAWNGVVNVFSGIFGMVKSIAEGVINGVIDKINLMTSLINKVPGVEIKEIGHVGGDKTTTTTVSKNVSTTDKTKAGISGYAPTLPKATTNRSSLPDSVFKKKALGTPYSHGGETLVGERGPEVVNLKKGDSVTTAQKTRDAFKTIVGGKSQTSKTSSITNNVTAPITTNNNNNIGKAVAGPIIAAALALLMVVTPASKAIAAPSVAPITSSVVQSLPPTIANSVVPKQVLNNNVVATPKAVSNSAEVSKPIDKSAFATAGAEIPKALGSGIETTSPAVLTSMTTLASQSIKNFSNGIVANSTAPILATNTLATNVKGVVTGLANNLNPLGLKSTLELSKGMQGGSAILNGATNGLSTSVKSTFGTLAGSVNPLGNNVTQGLSQGMQASGNDLVAVTKTLTDKVIAEFVKGFDIHSPSKVTYGLGGHVIQGFINGMDSKDLKGFVDKQMGTITGGFSGGGGSGKVAGWLTQAMAITGTDMSNFNGIMTMIEKESGFNPNAINLWDSNAKAGHPSRGLLQTIPTTFAAYRNKSLPNNIVNPLSNLVAGINYMKSRYGSVSNVPGLRNMRNGGGYVGYAKGTNNATKGIHLVGEKGPELLNFEGGETVTTASKTKNVLETLTSSENVNQSSVTNKRSKFGNIVQSIKQKLIPQNIPSIKDTIQNVKQSLVPTKPFKLSDAVQSIKQKLTPSEFPSLADAEQNVKQKLTPVKSEALKFKKNDKTTTDKPFIINMYGTIIREEADVDKVADALAEKLKEAEINLG